MTRTALATALATASNIIASGPAVIVRNDAAHNATAIANFEAAYRVMSDAIFAHLDRGGILDSPICAKARTKRDNLLRSIVAMRQLAA